MREWRRCPACGFVKAGACPQCFPRQAERELQQENAEALAAEDDRRRRDAGMIFCNVHEAYDGCIRKRAPAEVRAELRSEERRMSWREAMQRLRDRYVSP